MVSSPGPDDFSIPSDPAKSSGPARVLPSQVETWVKNRLSRFAVLAGIDERMHYTAQLAAIMTRLDYTPAFALLAGNDRLDPSVPVKNIGISSIISKHLSKELLEDLDATLELAETDSRVEALSLHDANGQLVEGTIYVGENGSMVYTDHAEVKVDPTEDHGEGWASW